VAIAVANSWEGSTTGADLPIAVSGISAGDVLVAITVTWLAASDPVVLIPTDNQTNTWTMRTQTTWSSTFAQVIAIADCKVAAAGPTFVTVRGTSGDFTGGVVLRVTGHDPSSYADQFNNKTQAVDDPTGPTIICSGGNRLYVQALTRDSGGSVSTTQPSGYTMQQERESNDVGTCYAVATKVAAATTETLQQWVTGSSNDWTLVAGSYRESAIASPGDTMIPMGMLGTGRV
jgi:hypothetical protein